jgi:hypothetical protein
VDSALKSRTDAALLEAAFEDQGKRWTRQLENLRSAISQRSRLGPERCPGLPTA